MDNDVFVDLISIADELPSRFRSRLYDIIEDIAEEYDLCPECGQDLEAESYDEYRGEYFGAPCTEEVIILECPDCGYSRD